MTATVDEAAVWAALEEIPDPEIPVVSLVDQPATPSTVDRAA